MSFTSPERSAYGGGQTGRKPYDEQTLIPVTIRMLLNSKSITSSGGTGQLTLADGREINTIKFVGAVRNTEEQSTHIRYSIEDGTGLIDVKQFVDEGSDSAYLREEREKTTQDNVYVRVIGQLKDYENTNSVVAFSVRTLSTGNELTHHMLETVHSSERYKKEHGHHGGSGMMLQAPTPFGTNAPLSSPAPPAMNMMRDRVGLNQGQQGQQGDEQIRHDAVLNFFKENDEDIGTDVTKCKQTFANRYSEAQIQASLDYLCLQGFIYSTIDESKYKFSCESNNFM